MLLADSKTQEDMFQLPETTEIGSVTLQITDLARSLTYYQSVIGLEIIEQTAKTAQLGIQSSKKVLVELVENKDVKPIPQRSRLGLYHFAILLPDAISLGHFLKHLARNNIYAGMSDHAFSRALYLTDPDGLGIEIYADRPRDLWPRDENDMLAGAADPLNVQELLAEAREGDWQGIPEGTSIGHVHFYVSDLYKAENFYVESLGFDITIKQPMMGALFVSAGGYHHHVGLNTWARSAKLASENDAKLLQWELKLEDPKLIAERLQTRGYRLEPLKDGYLATDPWNINVNLRSL